MASNLNDTTPAAVAGGVNVKWQTDGAGNDSAYVMGGVSGGVLTKTGTYAAAAGDSGSLVSFSSASALSYTLLASAPAATWVVDVENVGAGVLTIAHNTRNIDGAASDIIVEQNQGLRIFSNGTNYYTQRGLGLGGNINAQTGNYNAAGSDQGKLISCSSSSAFTVTLPGPPPSASWYVFIKNINTGVITVSRNSLTIDGRSNNLTLAQGDSVGVYTDGTNYFTSEPRIESVRIFLPGAGTNNQVVTYLTMDRATVFPASAPNSYANAKTAATASTTYTFKKNGSSFATTVFAMAGTTGTFTQASDAVFAAGDILELDGPASADATLANVGFTLQGYRF